MAELGVSNFWGAFAGETFRNIINYSLWGLIIAVVGYFVYRFYADRKIFKNPVRVWRQRQNGQTKEFNTRGGYVKSRKGVTSFIIKLGRFKKQKMPELPDPDMIDSEDRVFYFQTSPVDYIQTRAEFIYEPIYIKNPDFQEPTDEKAELIVNKWKGELKQQNPELSEEEAEDQAVQLYNNWVEENKGQWKDTGILQVKPLNQASKEAVINDIILAKQVLGVDVNKQFMYFVAGVIALVILGIVIFYIATNEGSLPLLEFAPLLFLKWRKKQKKK